MNMPFLQQKISGSPSPHPAYTEPERKSYNQSLRFEYGFLDDGTIWIRTPSKGLFHVDWLTLRLLMELNAGMPVVPLCTKYKIDQKELNGLIANLRREGAIVSPREGKITKSGQQDDIHIAPFVLLFFLLAAIQIEYFQNIARTFRLGRWYDALIVGLISIIPIILHELGHYLSARKYFAPRLGFTFLWFFPAVYMDTHAAWCLPRNIRLLINSAGILMDMGLNSLLVALAIYYPAAEYYVTPLLILQYTRWSIIMNPLVNGDGYWLLSDFSRTVNMRQKGKEYLRKKRFHWLSIYGLLSVIFSIFSIMGLLWFVMNLIGLGGKL
ncbi:hypothetical protein JXL19_09770 [bacterium]|nr:hypothetical protein [bacterium]